VARTANDRTVTTRLALSLLFAAALGCATTPASPAAAHAQDAFERQQWDAAAVASANASSDSSTPTQARQMAELQLALSLGHLGFRTSSLTLVTAIATDRKHAARLDALPALASLAQQLPDVADVATPLYGYSQEQLEDAVDDLPPDAGMHLRWLLGAQAYHLGKYEEAIARLDKVTGAEAAKAQILVALSHTRNRKSVPTAAALAKAIEIARASPDDPEARRLVDLATLLNARLFYSAAVSRVEDRRISVSVAKLARASRDWHAVDPQGEFGSEAGWERAWVYLAIGAHEAAIRDLERALSDPDAYLPEAEQLLANVRWSAGDLQGAARGFQHVLASYQSTRDALLALTRELVRGGDRGARALALVVGANERPDDLPPDSRRVLRHALRDRQLVQTLAYTRAIAAEQTKLRAMPPPLRGSAAQKIAERALQQTLGNVTNRIAEMVRVRVQRELADLDEILAATPR